MENCIWWRLGLHSGRVWDGLGPFDGALWDSWGPLGGSFGALGALLGRSWAFLAWFLLLLGVLGRFLHGFWVALAGLWEGLGKAWGPI